MLRLAKRIFCLAMLGLSVQCASAFSLLGPFEPYQVPVLTYQVGGDLGGPHNLGEEFRRNTPVMYYTFDANFLDYFGTDGSNAIVQAFEIMNSVFNFTNVDGRVITNVSDFQPDLSEFPMEVQSYNYAAQALQLLDLKSVTLLLIVEQMGLAEPDRYTWTLHDRLMGTPCPQAGLYTVIKRNFDPAFSSTDQLQPTSYVNGRLYSYFLQEFCQGTPFLSDAVEYPVDQLANVFTAVAAGFSVDLFRLGIGLDFGGYYNGLTRDDVGGLRYLLRTNNMNIEAAGADTFTFFTNNNTFQLLFTSNLTLFAAQALTNNAGALNALYPDLIITSTTLIFTNLVTTNQIAFFQNSPYAPVGSPATLVTNTTFTTNVAIWFRHTFANVVTNSVFTSGVITLLTTNIGPCTYGPVGSICTNITAENFTVPMIMGDFFIIPSNLCSFAIVSTQLVYVLSETNLIVVATNAPTTTNVNGQEFSQSIITYSTNSVFVVNPVVCPSNSVALRQGIGGIKFVRRDFDSLLNRFFYPITNVYTVYAVTNNTLIPQRVERFVTQPDFLITASDLATTPADPALGAAAVARNLPFDTNSINPTVAFAGPGTIVPGTAFIFDKVGPIYLNQFTGFFLGGGGFFISAETNQTQLLVWGSFDGTTNAPVVYPNGTSITNLENSVLIRVSPSGPVTNGVVQLPNGTVGVDYSTVFSGFTATGGQPPYSWGMSPGSALPPDLVLNADGTINGAPDVSTAGLTFDFVIRMTDAGSRFVDRPYAITINP
jgi:hypothetical protein